MRASNFVLLALALLAILLSGCTLGILDSLTGGGSKAGTLKVDYNSIHTGSMGIDFSFAQERPQSSYVVVPNGNDITLLVGMENKGAWDVPAGQGYVAINYDPTYFDFGGKDKTSQPFDLEGKKLLSPIGEKTKLQFDGKIKELKEVKKDTAINAVACYSYGTEFVFDVCIDTDPTNVKTTPKACDLLQNKKKYSSLSGQGGPVVITKLDQAIRRNGDSLDIDFIISVRNAGRGRAYDTTATPQKLCIEGGDLDSADKVRIKAELTDVVAKCETDVDDTVPMPEGIGGIVNCRVVGYPISENTDSFLSKLKITLTYSYFDSYGRAILLKKAGARI